MDAGVGEAALIALAVGSTAYSAHEAHKAHDPSLPPPLPTVNQPANPGGTDAAAATQQAQRQALTAGGTIASDPLADAGLAIGTSPNTQKKTLLGS